VFHISSITAKASLCSNQILHTFITKNVWILLKAYKTYVGQSSRVHSVFSSCWR